MNVIAVWRGHGYVRRHAWLLALAALLALVVRGHAVRAENMLTLSDALARARSGHPLLRAAQADVDAARGRLMQARLIPANPVISGDMARHTAPPEENLDRGISLAQEVEVGGQAHLRVRGAEHDVARAERLYADRWRTLGAEIRRAFAGLTAAARRRALAAESAGLAERVLAATNRRSHAGDVAELEVKLAEIETARAAQALATAETDLARANARLATAVGAEAQETFTATTDDLVATLPPDEEILIERALSVRPDLSVAREERARLDAEAQLTHRRAWVPNPTFRGFYRHEQANEEIVGGEVSVPFPVWNREQGTEIAARAAARAAAAEADRLTREIPREVHLALVRRRAAAAAWDKYQRETVPAADAVRTLIERAYGGGYIGLPDVLVQQDRLVQVRAAAIGAWLDLREAEADVIEAVGEESP